MDQFKSDRLNQFKDVITGMVSYSDIYKHLLEDLSISIDLHNAYLHGLKHEDKSNASVMAEVVELLKKRKTGFDKFVEILRRTDYIWLAEQLDPNCEYSEPHRKRNSYVDSLVSTVARKSFATFNRRKTRTLSVDTTDETVYTTYRDSYASDISCESRRTSCSQLTYESDSTNTTAFSDLGKTFGGTNDNENDSTLRVGDIDETLTEMCIGDGECEKNDKRKSVIVYNIPEANTHFIDHIIDTRQFEKVAKSMGLSGRILKDLKLIRVGRIGKRKSNCKNKGKKNAVGSSSRPLKARFKTEEGCKRFLQSVQDHGGIVKTEFGEITVEPCDLDMSLTIHSEEKTPKRRHWYQRKFF